MAYTTEALTVAEIRSLTNAGTTTLPTATVTLKIAESDALIDGYLRKAYTIPFAKSGVMLATTPALIAMIAKKLSAALCVLWLYEIKSIDAKSTTSGQKTLDDTKTMLEGMIAREDAMPLLDCDYASGVKMNAQGGFSYGSALSSTQTWPSFAYSTTQTYNPTFNELPDRKSVV